MMISDLKIYYQEIDSTFPTYDLVIYMILLHYVINQLNTNLELSFGRIIPYDLVIVPKQTEITSSTPNLLSLGYYYYKE